MFSISTPEQTFELPKEGGNFIPTIQLKSGKAIIAFKFEVNVPKDYSKISEMIMEEDS